MKKYFYFLAIAVLFAACQPNNDLGTPFQKGQKVTLSATIANPDGGAKQMPGKQRVSGLDDTPSDPINGAIKLTWNEGDEIKVTVNGQSATFTLKEGYGGSSIGEFEGTMPADGNSYTVTYPVEAPALTTQTYVENGFGEGLMAMSGEGTLEEGFVLTATNALLGLRLTGSKALSDIVVTNNQGGTYTLNCAGVTLKDEATLFYIVVPAGTWANGFKVEVLQDDKSLISEFEKTSSATFTPNQAMVMPAKAADYDLKTLTFEDWTDEEDKSFEPYDLSYGAYPTISTWSELIDDPQCYGALLYGYGGDMSEGPWDDDIENRIFYSYYWCDENNTVLKHRINSMWGYMGGGIAISNYTCSFDEISDYGTFDYQLTVLDGGNNASSNFCAVNAMEGMGTIMSFGDEKARIIDHLYVTNTTYGLNTYLYGQGNGCPAPQNGEKVKIIATPTDEYGEVISDAETSEFYLCDGPDNVVQDWTKWDLSKLGKVYGLAFSIEAYGGVPYVFAIDDIAVRFPKE